MRDRWVVWPILATFAGIGLLVAAYLTDGYASNLLLQVGSTFVLLFPVVVLSRLIERRVHGRSEPDPPTPAPDEDPPAEPEQSRRSVAVQLGAAAAAGAIAPDGVRVRVPGGTHRLRVRRTSGDGASVVLGVEELTGRSLGELTWPEDQPDGVAVVQRLLADTGMGARDDPTVAALLAEVRAVLDLAVDSRAGGRVHGLGPLIEAPNPQWVVSADGLHRRDAYYFISRQRVLDPSAGWRTHTATKDWVDAALFHEAFDIAAALYALAPSSAPPPEPAG